MKKAILAIALGAGLLFASNALAAAWCAGTSGECTAKSTSPDATGCSDPATGVQAIVVNQKSQGCVASGDESDGCIGGNIDQHTGAVVGCVCAKGICGCTTGLPGNIDVGPAPSPLPCDKAACEAAATAACNM